MIEELGLNTSGDEALFGDVAGLIERARTRAAVAVNSELVMLYWSVGKRIREEVLGGRRAAYGEQVIRRLAEQLTKRFGRGWSRPNLLRMVQFADCFPDDGTVSTLSRQLSCSHFAEVVNIPEQHGRYFYTVTAARERWSVRTLRERIASKLYATSDQTLP